MGITLGIIGGIAPPSTVDYYRQLIAGYREHRPDAYPSIVINSIDLTRLLRLVADGRMTELVDYLGAEIERLARAGAGCGLLPERRGARRRAAARHEPDPHPAGAGGAAGLAEGGRRSPRVIRPAT
jgi:hypothetical protein